MTKKLLKAILHAHTGEEPLDAIAYDAYKFLDRAAEKKFEIVAFTCHDFFFWDEKVKKYAGKKNILLIPGIEKKIEGKHVVILNADKNAETIEHFKTLREYKTNRNCFIFAPHPYHGTNYCLGSILEKHMDLFDGIEWSYFYSQSINPNLKAKKTAEKHKKTIIGTSDIHLIEYLDPTFTWIESEKNIPAVLEALRNNKTKIESKPFKNYELAIILGKMFSNPLRKILRSLWKILSKK